MQMEKEGHRMRLIDKGKLLSVLNDNWLTITPMDNNSEEVKAERNAMCRGLDIAMDIVQSFPEVETVKVGGWISVNDRLPESGKSVLVSCQIKLMSGKHKYYVCEAMYTALKTVSAGAYDAFDDFDADYDEETDTYYYPEGWWELIHNWDDYSCVAIADFVTHWMPLPSTEGLQDA